MDLSASTALITGAGREPARSAALALAAAGCRLALNDLVPQRLEETAALARAAGAPVSVHVGDASKGLFARGLVEEVLDIADLDILINCPAAEPRRPLIDLDEWDFQRTLEANAGGPFLLIQFLARWLRSEGRPGTFVNLITAPLAPPALPGGEAFYTSQMALRALTVSAAPGLAALGVRLFGICAPPALAAPAAARLLELLDPRSPHPAGIIFDFGEAP